MIKKGRYKHYKGNFYEVLETAMHAQTQECLVVYKALYESATFDKNTLWVRTFSNFTEEVAPNQKRFVFVE